MQSRDRSGWFALLVPVLLCLPCLVGTLLALGGSAALAAAGGAVIGTPWLLVAGPVVGGALALGLLAVRRRGCRTAPACRLPPVTDGDPAPEHTLEISR